MKSSSNPNAKAAETGHEVLIRNATPADLPALTELLDILFRIEQDFTPDSERQAAGLIRLMKSETARIFVAEEENRVVGMCTVQLMISTAEGGLSGLVEDVVIHPTHRRRGIGTRLLQEISEYAVTTGVTRLQLLADCDNTTAIQFYLARDWQQTNLKALRCHPIPLEQ